MRRIGIYATLLVPLLCDRVFSCPLCRDSTAISGNGSPPVALFNASVLWILGIFVAVVAVLIAKIIGAVRSIDHFAA